MIYKRYKGENGVVRGYWKWRLFLEINSERKDAV